MILSLAPILRQAKCLNIKYVAGLNFHFIVYIYFFLDIIVSHRSYANRNYKKLHGIVTRSVKCIVKFPNRELISH